MKNTFLSILWLACTFSCFPLNAAEQKDSVTFYFHRGKSDFDTTFSHNNLTLRHLESLSQKGIPHISDIRISGAASPEGPVNLNNNLSDRRAETIMDIISTNMKIASSDISSNFT